jgi:hypothetical protein
MTSRFIACLLLACAVAACDPGPAGPPTAPSDPTKTGYEPPGGSTDTAPGGGGSIEQLCAYDCMRFEAICPGSGGTECVPSCTQAVVSIPGCKAEFQMYLACVAAAPVTCTNGNLDLSGCDGAMAAVNNCAGTVTGSGGGMAGGGSAGVSGGAPAR